MNNKALLKYLIETCFDISLAEFEKRNVKLNKNNKQRYSPIVDFKLETNDTIYLVEMQNRNLYNMSERCLFSFSRQCQNTLKPRDDFKNMKKIKILIFINYKEYKDSSYQLLGNKYQSYFSDKLEILIFDIIKNKESKNINKKNISLLFSIKNKVELNNLILNNKERIIRNYIKKFNMDKKALLEIERRDALMCLEKIGLINAREAGFKEGQTKGIELGISQGITQGLNEGRKEATTKMILNLLDHKMSLENIAKITEYPISEIQKIAKKR